LLASGEAVLHEFDWGRQWVSLKSITPIDSEGLDLLHLRTGDYGHSRDPQEFLCVFHLLEGLRSCTDAHDIFSNHTDTRILGSFSDRINVAVLERREASDKWVILTLGVLAVSERHDLTWNDKASFNLTAESREYGERITVSQGEQSGKVWVRRNVRDESWRHVVLTEIDSDWKGVREIRLEDTDDWSLNGQFPGISDWNGNNMLWMFRESVGSLDDIFTFSQSCNVSLSNEKVAVIESDVNLDVKRIRFLPGHLISGCDFSFGSGILCRGYLWTPSTSSDEATLTYIPLRSSDPIQTMSFRDVFDQSSHLWGVIGLSHNQLLVYGDQPALVILNSTKLLEYFSGSQSSESTACVPSKEPMKLCNVPENVITSVIVLEPRSDPDKTRNDILQIRRFNDSHIVVFVEAGGPLTHTDPASVKVKLFAVMMIVGSEKSEKAHPAHSPRRNFWLPFGLSLALIASIILAILVFSRRRSKGGKQRLIDSQGSLNAETK